MAIREIARGGGQQQQGGGMQEKIAHQHPGIALSQQGFAAPEQRAQERQEAEIVQRITDLAD